MIIHPIKPVYDENSEILILGSFPSVRSREEGFFYGNPTNRFWKVLGSIYGEDVPKSIEAKTSFLLKHGIALWDVISSCDISGSSDSTIKNVTANDIRPIIDRSHIGRIFVNGKKAEEYYGKYILPVSGIRAEYLPSTSPANASFGLEELTGIWKNTIFAKTEMK